eukprot:TRINITY_DN2909_c0_g2_i1.p1 TRINITY_DN2909_c0_g2~~TRINITY_DN2909_c0_g2_i1.p1  ORF type:complete len:514 (+),score=96.15 TRINITY_DN2909_c0_g2_i1:137-1678(+)
MFPSSFCYDGNGLGSAEAPIAALANSYRSLIMDGAVVDTKSEEGYNAAAMFLQCIDSAAIALRLRPADRSYRSRFTINYQALFPDRSRNYRVDMLEASIEQNSVIWVNGDKFEFSEEAMTFAQALQRNWAELCTILHRWGRTRPMRAELQRALLALDNTWASFERTYISELIEIEARPRKLLWEAIEYDRKLTALEKYGRSKDVKIAQEKLVGCISNMNSRANTRRKGRDDLSVEVLWDALRMLKKCDEAERNGQSSDLLSAARSLSGDVVSSFDSIRDYLRQVAECLERVDPHLCNNDGLVSRLVDWEESWELGKNYVQDEQLLNGICDLVAEIRLAQQITPALKTMCEDCDVELFMVMPRILWLRGLMRPAIQESVLKSLLPNRFLGLSETDQWNCDDELKAFVAEFSKVNSTLMSNCHSAGRISDRSAWEILIKRVVTGNDKAGEDAYASLSASVRALAEPETEAFVNKLESWSMELQRHQAEDWNGFASIILQCLSGTGPRKELPAFQV